MLVCHVHEDVLARGRLIGVHDEIDLDARGIRNDDHRGPLGAEGDIESELPVEGKRERLVRHPDADVVDLLNLDHGCTPWRGYEMQPYIIGPTGAINRLWI
jgi:hypothetical protein